MTSLWKSRELFILLCLWGHPFLVASPSRVFESRYKNQDYEMFVHVQLTAEAVWFWTWKVAAHISSFLPPGNKKCSYGGGGLSHDHPNLKKLDASPSPHKRDSNQKRSFSSNNCRRVCCGAGSKEIFSGEGCHGNHMDVNLWLCILSAVLSICWSDDSYVEEP